MKIRKQNSQAMQAQMQKLDSKIKHAAKLYERQFLKEMVKAMRKSVTHSALTQPSMAEKIYQDQLDDKYVDNWVDRGGTGFADMVYNQIVEKFYPQLGRRAAKQIRPVSLSDRFQGATRSKSEPNKETFHLDLKPTEGKSYLQVPWQGKLQGQFEMENGQKVAVFSHPFGLKSTIAFQGKTEPGLLNKTLSSGEKFAELTPGAQSVTWQVQGMDSHKAPSIKENQGFE